MVSKKQLLAVAEEKRKLRIIGLNLIFTPLGIGLLLLIIGLNAANMGEVFIIVFILMGLGLLWPILAIIGIGLLLRSR